MDKIVTFIILAYNVEQYLNKCLDSFLCPSVMKLMEVLIIDDGSTDKTGKIADDYASQYPQTFCVIHKENGGHGSGINIGSHRARGKYFKAIDADDWVITENLPGFITALSKCEADVVLTPFHTVDMMTGERKAKYIANWKSNRVTVNDILSHWSDFEDVCVFHGITYRSDFYRNSRNMLPEHTFYEDQVYNAIPFCNAEHIAISDIFVYQYMIGNAQQSVSCENQAKRIDHVERVLWSLIAYYQSVSGLSETAKTYLFERIKSVCLIYLATAFVYEKDKKKGRKLGRCLCGKLRAKFPEAWRAIRNKYGLYSLMNYGYVAPKKYQELVQSANYRTIKNRVKGVLSKK
ncbi:glycosyltransferase family 2 protein [Anaeromassilibacillus senegalensis]|uniref:Glycosyltransferase family 2 protein n=1 Tax=Anaeromassilibacillus senegalensis TaxID=1673717 RepID=A0ABS9CS55_9FIRM|nr:glycosyltransferase family 2 protein [Anaeromassilibacillus senegalensis]MCF2653176.1 glycosyltransferase family 2 protein [Anaeromassilibacillus senegalensis]